MELDQLKEKWIAKNIPVYTSEELDSIFHIKQGNILSGFKLNLSKDLIIAEALAIGFVVVLQLLNFRTSDFWSLMMLFLAAQHLIIYSLQNRLIAKLKTFNLNIPRSLKNLIDKMTILLWIYRIWPTSLSLILYSIYILQFSSEWTNGVILITGLALASITLIISNSLSAVLVRNHLKELKNILQSLEELKSK